MNFRELPVFSVYGIRDADHVLDVLSRRARRKATERSLYTMMKSDSITPEGVCVICDTFCSGEHSKYRCTNPIQSHFVCFVCAIHIHGDNVGKCVMCKLPMEQRLIDLRADNSGPYFS